MLNGNIGNLSVQIQLVLDHPSCKFSLPAWKNFPFQVSLTYKNPIKLCPDSNSTLDIFTGGSKSASKVGYAAIILNSTSIHSQISGRLPGYSSPYDAEAFALMEALLFINNEVHTHDQVCIFSDSRSNLT